MSDHNIIQVETNVKIVEEKQNHQTTKEKQLELQGLELLQRRHQLGKY